MPTVGSTWSPDKAQAVFTSAPLRHEHVTALVHLVRSNGFDGIDLDYEGFTWPNTVAQTRTIRHAYAAFVGDLCAELHDASKMCTITLGPVTADGPRIVSDYRAIGRAANLVRLMCYDLHGPWSKPGPVSTTPWTDRVLTYAVSQIPRSKVELDVPTYGYQWPTPKSGDASLSWAQVWHLVTLHHLAHAVHYDTAAGEATFQWRSGGRLHTVWFETPRSLAGTGGAGEPLPRPLARLLAAWHRGPGRLGRSPRPASVRGLPTGLRPPPPRRPPACPAGAR